MSEEEYYDGILPPKNDPPSWFDSDNDARSPLEADLEDIDDS